MGSGGGRKTWLLTIAEAKWRPKGGEHIASIGPLPVNQNTKYNAQHMEAIMDPGTVTALHRHPGSESWYTESGETCLETPEGKQAGQNGVNVVVQGGQPMRLSVTGTDQRRSLVLVLHDASQPWMVMRPDWTPKRVVWKIKLAHCGFCIQIFVTFFVTESPATDDQGASGSQLHSTFRE